MTAPACPVSVMQRRVTLITSIIISGSYVYVLGREEQLSSNKALVMTNIILTWAHIIVFISTLQSKNDCKCQEPEKTTTLSLHFFYFNLQRTAHFCSK